VKQAEITALAYVQHMNAEGTHTHTHTHSWVSEVNEQVLEAT